MCEFRFSSDVQVARNQFSAYVDDIIDAAKQAKRDGTPLPYPERLRRVDGLCIAWMDHSTMVWGPGVVDLVGGDMDFVGEHRPYNYAPPPYQLQRLAEVLLQL